MTLKLKTACLILALAIACAGLMRFSGFHLQEHLNPESEVVRKMRWLDSANPEHDVAAALSQGDTRFCGTYGFTSDAPGVDKATAEEYGIRFIDGTGCVIHDDEHGRLDSLANDYARRYNVLLLKHLKH